MLGQAKSYEPLGPIPSRDDPIAEITTHGARVFLVDNRAFKIKRPLPSPIRISPAKKSAGAPSKMNYA